VYALLNATFLYVVTERKSGKRVKYREKGSKSSSVVWALVKKEAARYTTNPMILFNCGLGPILCLLFTVFLFFDSSIVTGILAAPITKLDVAMIATTVMLFIVSSTMITASCISLEGENLWLLRSMPIATKTIFWAKVAWHVLYASLPSIATLVIFFVMVKVPVVYALPSVLTVFTSAILFALMGLVINLKLPNLKWTNEIVVVKQSISPLIAMFGGWGISALVLGGYFWFGSAIGVWYFPVILGVFALASAALIVWTKTRGVEIFETLS
jgi:ABC-2 type transport system permease protein